MVCMDAFIVSHTSMEIELASQEQADRFLPPCEVPHRLDPAHPVTVGGMAFPQETLTHRMDLDQAIRQVPAVLDEHRTHSGRCSAARWRVRCSFTTPRMPIVFSLLPARSPSR